MLRNLIRSVAIANFFAIGLGLGTVVAFQNSLSVKAAASALLAESGAAVERGVAYGPDPRQRLDVYRPRGVAEKGPVILFLYGGGWRQGERQLYRFVGASFASRGYTTVIPDYRLYPQVRFPAFVEDAARAYGWVAENLKHADATPRPVVVMGHSAGAHIGALLVLDKRYIAALHRHLRQPAGFVGLSGPYAFDPTTWHSTSGIFAAAPSSDDARPVAFARADAPPMLVMHGLDDNVVKLWNMETLATAIRAKGAAIRPVELENVGHIGTVLALAWPLRWRAPVFEQTLDFMGALAGRDARAVAAR